MIRTASPVTSVPCHSGRHVVRKALALTLLTALLSVSSAFAMTDLYQLAQTTGSGTNMTGSTQIYGPNASYTSSTTTYPIGFTFIYDRTPYTTFSANTSGLMSLGRATNPYPYSYYWPNYSLSSYHPMLTALWCYYGAPTSTGKVHYKLTGTAPNRVLTVEWKDVHLVNSTSYSGGTWQVRLHEGSNLIQFWYGPFINRYDYYYFTIGMTSSDTRYINLWGNDVTQYYTYPSGQYFTYRYPEYYPISENTIFEFSSCDKGLSALAGNIAEGGTKGMKSGDTLLAGKQVMRGNVTGFRPFSFDLPINPCEKWTYSVSFSGPGAADYSVSPGNGTIITEGMAPTINFTPQGTGIRQATMTLRVSNGEQFVYTLKGEGISRISRVGTVAEGGTTGMNDGDMLLTNIDVPRLTSRDLRPFRIANINTAPTSKGLANASVTFRLDDPYDQYSIRLAASGNSEKETSVQSITTLSTVLTPGASVTPIITFAPNAQGSEQGTGIQPATLTVTADGEVYVYTLNGYSVAPVAEFFFKDERVIGSSKRLFVGEVTCTGEEAASGSFVIRNNNKVPVVLNRIEVFQTENEVRQGTPPYPQMLDGFGNLIPVLDYFLSENSTVAPYRANTIVQFPLTIAPGEERRFHLGFVAQRPGKRFSRLFLHTNAVNFAGMEAAGYLPNATPTAAQEGILVLDLFGYGRGSNLAKNAEGERNGLAMVFDPVKVRQSTTAETWLHNTGECDMRINKEDIRLMAGDVNEFELLEILPNTTVDANGDFIIAPGGSDKITARFTPVRSGSRRASVMLKTNDSTLALDGISDRGIYSLDLYGVGQAYLEARSIMLPPAVIDGPGSKGQIVVTNASTEVLTITAADLAGPNIGEIAPDPSAPWPTLPLSIQPGERAKFSVVLIPTTGSMPGERKAALEFTLANGDPVSAQITGLAGTRSIVANPTSMFRNASVPVGSVVREYAVLTNIGTFPLHVDQIRIIGANAADYKLSPMGNLTLAPGASQFVEVTYTPTMPGASSAQIEVTSNATNGVQYIELGGTATGTSGAVNPNATGTARNPELGASRTVAGQGVMTASVTPNPARDRATVTYVLVGEGRTQVALYDVSGREVATLRDEYANAGEQTVQADLSGLAGGIYYIVVRQGDRTTRQAVVITR